MMYDPYRVAMELREQLASDERRLAIFFGAGTSMAVGLPGIVDLTNKIPENLKEPQKSQYGKVKADLSSTANVEDILGRIRLYRELIGDSSDKDCVGIKGKDEARALDQEICLAIAKLVKTPTTTPLKPHTIFGQWLRVLHTRRQFPVEIFTTNYDLLLERALEDVGVPFFDGFVGSVQPFFAPECVEAEESKSELQVYPPRSWSRVWKLHGSTNWRLRSGLGLTAGRITRVSDSDATPGEELIIFPSREKYAESRKLPFISFQDRLRKFVSGGERLLIVLGYSFSDQHINQILFQGMKSNSRLAVSAVMYGVKGATSSARVLPDEIYDLAKEHRNLAIYGPDRACIGGLVGSWTEPSEKRADWPFWDYTNKQFTLGDFSQFSSFLERFIGIGLQPSPLGSPADGEKDSSPSGKEKKS